MFLRILKYILEKSGLGFLLSFIESNQNQHAPFDDICSICLNAFQYPVQFLCKHQFCAPCFCQYWNQKNNQRIDCPNCRSPVTLVSREYEQMPGFIPNQNTQRFSKEIRKYNQKFSNESRNIIQMMKEMPQLIKLAYQVMKTWAGIIYFITKFLFNKRNIFFILYILSPFDLIPEALFGVFGLIDDASIGYSLMVIFANTIYGFLQQNEINLEQ